MPRDAAERLPVPNLALLKEEGGRTFIRFVETAIAEFENIRIR
jgi:hypothetical protein